MRKCDVAYRLSDDGLRIAPSLDEIASEWDSNVTNRAAEMENRIDTTFNEIIAPLFGKLLHEYGHGRKVVDVGCGLGFLSKLVSDKGYVVSGVDISRESIEYARRRFSEVDFLNTSIVEFARGHRDSFHICIANMVLHNLTDLGINLKAVHYMLRENGIFLISIPHPWFWLQTRQFAAQLDFAYLEEKFYKVPFKIRGAQTHRSPITYSHRPISRYFIALRDSGFEIVTIIEPRNHHPALPVDLLFWVCRKRGMPSSPPPTAS